MEILRINILPQEEILRREAFQREVYCCSQCGTPVKLEYTSFAEAPLVREHKECTNCGHKASEDFAIH